MIILKQFLLSMSILGQKSCILEPISLKFYNRTDINVLGTRQRVLHRFSSKHVVNIRSTQKWQAMKFIIICSVCQKQRYLHRRHCRILKRNCTNHGLRTHPKFSTAQNHIPNPNRKSCKIYENLNFLQKKCPSNAKSQIRGSQ